MATTTATNTKVKISLSIPEELFDEYAERATKRGITVEKELLERLTKCRTHTSTTSLYFDDDQRARLSAAINHTLTSPEDVISKLNNLVRVKVSDLVINLPAKLQLRLATRVFRGQTLEGVVTTQVIEGLERFAGLRPY